MASKVEHTSATDDHRQFPTTNDDVDSRLISARHHHFLPRSFEPTLRQFSHRDGGIIAWSSRDHRKGIKPKLIRSDLESRTRYQEKDEPPRRRIRWIGNDLYDISWWVAIIFVLGSIFWCVNGISFYCYFQTSLSSLDYSNTESAFAFLGGTTFVVGAYLGWVESLNPSRDLDFSKEVESLYERSRFRGRHHFGTHHTPASDSTEKQRWKWYGTHPSIAYLANTIQLCGASIFFLSVLVGLPGVLPISGSAGGIEQQGSVEGLWIGLFWSTQVIGAPCFVVAAIMLMLEVQEKWYRPSLFSLGWQINFWNAIGGVGFFLSGVFGIWRQTSLGDPSLYQREGTALSTFWGSFAFLIGSYMQLWECINK